MKIISKIIFFATFALICCCSQKKNANVILSSDSSADSVSQILNNSTVTAYRDGNKLWELKSQEIMQMTLDYKIKASPVHLTLFSDSAKVSAILTADSGVANERIDTLFVWGNVNIDAHSGEKLIGQTLQWRKDEKILVSDDFVELRSSDGEIIRGRGFRAAQDFEWWDFSNEVSGNFPSIDAEFEKGE
ncbi:MAG: LPS export ABC transporter periplasmic protein LptC [Chitinivibrionia bacterium]|nr:LPS export ABC transporter periplasmic protein LptC [Chitinivibrionia bacterium]